MGALIMEGLELFVRPPISDDELFDRWVEFGGGWTLDEFTEAYRIVEARCL